MPNISAFEMRDPNRSCPISLDIEAELLMALSSQGADGWVVKNLKPKGYATEAPCFCCFSPDFSATASGVLNQSEHTIEAFSCSVMFVFFANTLLG